MIIRPLDNLASRTPVLILNVKKHPREFALDCKNMPYSDEMPSLIESFVLFPLNYPGSFFHAGPLDVDCLSGVGRSDYA